jgi:hypothetical protein
MRTSTFVFLGRVVCIGRDVSAEMDEVLVDSTRLTSSCFFKVIFQKGCCVVDKTSAFCKRRICINLRMCILIFIADGFHLRHPSSREQHDFVKKWQTSCDLESETKVIVPRHFLYRIGQRVTDKHKMETQKVFGAHSVSSRVGIRTS